MKKCSTADLKEGMLVSCPFFPGSPKVIVGPAYSLASSGGYSHSHAPMYRVKLADPLTGEAKNFDFPDPPGNERGAFWVIHEDDNGEMGSIKLPPGFEPCGIFSCRNPKVKGRVMCSSCDDDYRRDLDAYK